MPIFSLKKESDTYILEGNGVACSPMVPIVGGSNPSEGM
jgi:hypothetical protein